MLRSRGVTAIELVVILVVVIVLVAILKPVYTSNGHGGPDYKCLSNIKRLGLGAIMYSSDSDGRLPVASSWMDLTQSYVGPGNPFHDPGDGVAPNDYGYAFRELASSVAVADFVEPAKVILMFDSSLIGRNAHSELWSIPQEGRHRAQNGDQKFDNIFLVDGHSRKIESDKSGQEMLNMVLLADDSASNLRP